MNTPKPCVTCCHLYVDAMLKDNPLYMAECWKGHAVKPGGCSDYRDYRIQDAIDALEAAVNLPWIGKEYQAVGEMCESALEGLRRIQ